MKHSLPLLLALCLLLASCAGRGGPAGEQADPIAAARVWNAYLERADNAAEPYQDALSLRFGREGDTRRVTALMWGNGERALRLDVMAGVGVTVAMVAQSGEHFLIVSPMEKKAYFHEGERSPLLRVGVPLPLDLFQLDALLHGRYQAVFGTGYAAATTAKAGICFALTDGVGGSLTLDGAGLPAVWENDSWQARLSLDDRGLVQRLDVASARGDRGILLVKERSPHAPFTDEQLRIVIPEGTQVLSLREHVSR